MSFKPFSKSSTSGIKSSNVLTAKRSSQRIVGCVKTATTFIFVGIAMQRRISLRVFMQTVIKNIMYIRRYFDFILGIHE